MAPQPVVTGLSPKEGSPGTIVTIRGEFLGTRQQDLVGLTICGCDCLLSAEWKSRTKIIARIGLCKGKGDIIVTTLSGGVGSSTVQFRAYHETIGPTKESAVWVDESPIQALAWGRRTLAPTGYSQEDPLGLSIEGNDKKFNEDLRDIFPECCGDLSQDNFSPGWFLLEHHHATSFEDLKAGLFYLRRKVESQKQGQLTFLKSNAGSVIDQLDTLVMLREKFCKDTEQYSKEPIKNLENAIEKSISESHNLFNDILTRREKADATRSALQALLRYKFLFCLPNSVEQHAKKEEYDIVLNDYIRAKNLFGKTEVVLFKKVLSEVDNRIIAIRKDLCIKLKTMPQSVDHQKKFVKALINLETQQLNAQISEKFQVDDPAWDAIESRSNFLEISFQNTFEQFSTKDDRSASPSGKNRDQNTPPNRVLFCEEITEVASNQLPDLWRLGQAYFTGELRGIHEPKPGNFKRIILTSIEKFCDYLRSALLPPPKTSTTGIIWTSTSPSAFNQFSSWIPHCLRYVRITYASLIRLDLPSEALDIILKLIDEIRLFCLSTIFKRSVDKVKKIGDKETWEMSVPDFPGATSLASHLEAILVEILEEGQQTCLAPEIRENSILEPNSEGQREISQRLQEILSTFCNVIENLAFHRSDSEEQQHAPIVSQLIGLPVVQASPNDDKTWSSFVPYEQRLLCSLANCFYCNKIFYPKILNLFSKFGYPQPKLAVESSRSAINSLFTNILETYVEHKSDPLVGTIEPSMYLGRFQWNTLQKTGKLRPYAQECLDNLVGVYSEIFTISPGLLRPVLEPIVQIVAEELSRLMTCVKKFNAVGAIQANVDIKILRDALKLYSNESAKSFFMEALEKIPALSAEGNKQVNDILADVKMKMKLQLMSLTVVNP